MYTDDNKKGDMVPVDAPEAKGMSPDKHGGHKMDEGHKMVMHQLNNLHQNACDLLEHLAGCSTPHLEEEWVKKKITLAADYLDSVRDYVMSSHGKEKMMGSDYGKEEMQPEHDDGGGFMVVIEKRLSQR
tara:strand:- start:4053 stop:4439 length:387 start_codon:yes stop_codon:yes gene_type:complete